MISSEYYVIKKGVIQKKEHNIRYRKKMVIYSSEYYDIKKVGHSFETEMLEYGRFLAFYYNFNKKKMI